LCCYRKLNEPNHCPDRVYLQGLDPAARYTCEEGYTFSGSVLMNVGLPMNFFEHQDFASRVILFTKQ
ncbi:MAG: GH36 C-terminal domain-containing protein, partial [Firmicutes bacterium]|nr:GH36 C-terminal domain-containing protein [Bacillota bacterium]